jgi:hypothetical protein
LFRSGRLLRHYYAYHAHASDWPEYHSVFGTAVPLQSLRSSPVLANAALQPSFV